MTVNNHVGYLFYYSTTSRLLTHCMFLLPVRSRQRARKGRCWDDIGILMGTIAAQLIRDGGVPGSAFRHNDEVWLLAAPRMDMCWLLFPRVV